MSHSAQCHCNNITLQGALRHCLEEQLRTNGTVKKGLASDFSFPPELVTPKSINKAHKLGVYTHKQLNIILRDIGHFHIML